MRPAVIVTTGAGVAVPFAWVGRLYGARVVYVESLTRIERPSLTYRLIRPIVTRAYVQWPELSAAAARSTAAPSSTGRDLRHPRDQAYPFDRLLRGLEGVEEELVVQGGPSTFRPDGATWFDYLVYAPLRSRSGGRASSSPTPASAP